MYFVCILKERTYSLQLKLWLQNLFIYIVYEQYVSTSEDMSKPYLPRRNFLICDMRTMKNVKVTFLIKLMCWHIKMANEIQFWFCDFKSQKSFFKSFATDGIFQYCMTFKSPFANTKDFSVVTFLRRHVCFGYFDILDLCTSRIKIKIIFESFGCVFKELACFSICSFACFQCKPLKFK